MDSLLSNKEPNMVQMKLAISNSGGLFYQYRPCNRNAATIYDIENIRHGVVYAQTPLNMNDPFDSMIGFSSKKIYDNVISMLVSELEVDDTVKVIVSEILSYKALGKIAELITLINNIKQYLYSKRISMHQTGIPIERFVSQNASILYSKLPKNLKKYLNQQSFIAFSIIIEKLGPIEISEDNIVSLLHLNDLLNNLHETAEELRDKTYVPALQEFLSKLTVSCFSASGWNNQLMWSHYANSYSGICIEYDFDKIDKFIGFIYPVDYSSERPTLSLQDLGIDRLNLESSEIERCEVNITSIITYLLSKNTCWRYEDEWRIINIGDPNTPLFIDLPYIKSITLGINIDPICKHLIWDLCREKEITCYEISINTENFELTRNLLTDKDFSCDMDSEVEYISMLSQQIADSARRIEEAAELFNNSSENASTDFSFMRPLLADIINMISNAYYLKVSLNRISDNADEDLSSLDMPEDISEGVFQINTIIYEIEQVVKLLYETVPNFHFRSEYSTIQKQIFDINELIKKFNKIYWNSIYIKSESIIEPNIDME